MVQSELLFNSRALLWNLHNLAICGFLFIAMAIFFVSLYRSIGVNDIDAYAYIQGAHSLRWGLAYVDAGGNALDHWPPGYSLLLSTFKDPLQASYWINALSLATATSALFVLALQSTWPRLPAIGFAGAFGCGFLNSLAAEAKPDILAYAVFLIATCLVLQDRPVRRTIGFVLVSVLIPVKLIAVVFFPAFLLHDAWKLKLSEMFERWAEYLIASSVWSASVIAILVFNLKTSDTIVPPSHGVVSLNTLLFEVWRFVQDFFRAFLANWYGSIRPPMHLIVFATVRIAGVLALASLRLNPRGQKVRDTGLAVLCLSWALELVRVYYAGPRLMGFGLLLILLGCAPKAAAGSRWVAYGAACFAAAILNTLLVDRSGAAHPRYAAMAQQIEPFLDPTKRLYTNSLWLVDVHLGKLSIPIHERPPESSDAVCFLHVRLPNYDAVGAKVWPIAVPTETWTSVAEVDGASLFCRVPDRSPGSSSKNG